MSDLRHDVVVIGGGPAGSSAASYLARAGKRVVVLEKEHFPRFHIGESLLPYNSVLFRELGLQPKLEAAGFIVKHGAQFLLGNASKGTTFVFGLGQFTREPVAFQVERARFDEVLLRHAASCGAEVQEGVSVERVEAAGDSVTVTARDEAGAGQRHTARFVIDASGRGNLTGTQERVRDVHPRLRKLAVFGHFSGVKLDDGTRGGDTVIVRLENKWFWIIPLDASKTSVGLVMDRDEFAASTGTPEEIFQRWLDSSVAMTARMTNARLVTPIHVTSDFSYRNRTLFSPRVVRVGDAAGFLDPIFSSGVFLAMHSGKMAAQALMTAMARGSDGTDEFAPYERRFQSSLNTYWTMVEKFYTTPFMELFLEPRDRYGLASAINAILAGELEGGWRLWWRLRVFFLLVRLQARMALVPHVSFAPVPKSAA